MGFDKLSADAQNLINAYKVRINMLEGIGDNNLANETEKEKAKLTEMINDAFDKGKLSNEDYLEFYNQTIATKTETVEEQPATEDVAENKATVTNPVKTQTTRTESKQQTRINKELVTEYIREYSQAKTMTLSMMMNNWDNRTDLASFESEKAQVQAIVDIINAQNPQSRKDVNNLDRVVRNTLGKNMTNLQKEVLPNMIKLAEREVMVKKADVAADKYIELTAKYMKSGENKTYQQLYDEAIKESGLSGDYQKEASQILKAYIKKDAYKNSYLPALQEIYYGDKVMDKKQILAKLNKDFANDPIMLEVIKENEEVYRNNTKEGPVDIVVRALLSNSRQADLSGITQDDISELKKRNPKLATKLWAYVQSKGVKEDGTYSMDALYEIINKRSGADFFTNKSKQKLLSEYEHILEDFDAEGFHINKEELKQLLEFMSRKYAQNTHYFGDAVGYTPTAVVAGLGVLPALHKDVLHLSLNAQTIIKMTGASEEVVEQAIKDITANLGENAVVTATGEGINHQVLINLVKSKDNFLSGLTGAAAGIAAAILMNWAIGELPDEIACTNLPEDADAILKECGNDPQKLKDYIAKRHPQNGTSSLFILIDVYEAKLKEEGKEFDTQGFINYISGKGGSGSLVNCQELLGTFFEEKPVIPPEEPQPVSEEEPVEDIKYELDIKKEEDTVEVPPCSHKHYVKHGDTWSTLIHTYYQDTYNKYGWKATLKALREALGAKATDTDLPYYKDENGKLVIELPCELLEIQNKVGDIDKNRNLYNTNNFKAGSRTQGKPLANIKMTVVGYYAWDNDYTDAQGKPRMCYGDTPEKAVEALESETKKKYENRQEKIDQFK